MPVKFLYPVLPKRLFFIHVPKSAGTSLIDLLDSMYVQDEIFPEHYNVPRLEQMNPEEVRPYRFYRGHLPATLLLEKIGEPLTMITVLREPVSRLISNFEMRQRVPDPLDGLQPTLSCLTLKDFMNHPLYLTKFAHRATELVGHITFGKDGERIPNVDLALERLRECKAVGLMERFDDTLQLLAWKFRWPPLKYTRRKNVSPHREKRAAIPEEVKMRIREREWADARVYAEAQRLFEEAWERMQEEQESLGATAWHRRILEPHLSEEEEALQENGADFYDFQRVYPGQGWYVAERHPRYGVIRWSGPEEESFVYAYVKPLRPLRLLVQIVNWPAREVLEGLEIRVNGTLVGEGMRFLQKEEHRALLQVELPTYALPSDGVQEIGFRVPKTLSPKSLGLGSDERALGLCYQALMLYSV